ncbi:MAG: divergent polysaccharide deacetylase family protein [Proteobacteria bacterium]|nr:divergent polysaccharide deacetylase family protein [Pseudomonadota bacterium]
MGGSGWRLLAGFWLVLLLLAGAGAAVLSALGPPPRASVAGATRVEPATSAAAPAGASPGAQPPGVQPPAAQPPAGRGTASSAPPPGATGAATASAPPVSVTDPRSAVFLSSPGRALPGPVAGPDPTLTEPAKSGGGAVLPRMDASGRAPMQAYAAGFDRTTRRPRIGIVLAGIGLNQADSMDAVRKLPDAVTLAVSPYSQRVNGILDTARIAGHEYLLSLPMEPQGFPQNDAGDHALMTGADPAQNALRLDWSLSRIEGYAGVTNALGVLRGERFSAASELFLPLLAELARRGLFFVDARPGAGYEPGIWSASVDLVIDEPPDGASIDAKLRQLEDLARERGGAIGLAGAPRPGTVDRIAVWANGLTAKGLTLAPASALVQWRPPLTGPSATVPPTAPAAPGATKK